MKLVGNTEITMEYDTYDTTGYRTLTKILDPPNLHPKLTVSAGQSKDVYFIPYFTMGSGEIIMLRSEIGEQSNFQGYTTPHFRIIIYNFTILSGEESATLSLSLQSGQTLAEYFVSA